MESFLTQQGKQTTYLWPGRAFRHVVDGSNVSAMDIHSVLSVEHYQLVRKHNILPPKIIRTKLNGYSLTFAGPNMLEFWVESYLRTMRTNRILTIPKAAANNAGAVYMLSCRSIIFTVTPFSPMNDRPACRAEQNHKTYTHYKIISSYHTIPNFEQ